MLGAAANIPNQEVYALLIVLGAHIPFLVVEGYSTLRHRFIGAAYSACQWLEATQFIGHVNELSGELFHLRGRYFVVQLRLAKRCGLKRA